MLNKKVDFNRVLNIVLFIVLIGIIGFGWLYYIGYDIASHYLNINPQENRFQYMYSIYGSPQMDFKRPSYTAVHDNKIYVADTKNSRVAVFDYEGKFITDFGRLGNGSLISPASFTFIGNDIYVADTDTGKVHIFNSQGRFKAYFSPKNIKIPSSIFYHKDKIYLFDSKEMNVKIFDMNGKLLKVFGRPGTQPGEFYFAYSIYVNDADEIFVADSNNNRIQVFDNTGKCLQVITGLDNERQMIFSIPRGIAFDREGNLYTAEGLINSVTVLNKKYEVIDYLGDSTISSSNNKNPNTLSLPTGVFIDQNNRLYVTEFGNSRILVYTLN